MLLEVCEFGIPGRVPCSGPRRPSCRRSLHLPLRTRSTPAGSGRSERLSSSHTLKEWLIWRLMGTYWGGTFAGLCYGAPPLPLTCLTNLEVICRLASPAERSVRLARLRWWWAPQGIVKYRVEKNGPRARASLRLPGTGERERRGNTEPFEGLFSRPDILNWREGKAGTDCNARFQLRRQLQPIKES